MKKAGFRLLLWVFLFSLPGSIALASVKQEVYVTGTVSSFGGYTFTSAIQFTVKEPGEQRVGEIVVQGLYNGEYPWIMRIYTDNLHFAGIAGAVRRPAPAGLVAKDGRFVIPIQVNCPNFGPEAWRTVPDLNDPEYRPYRPSSEPREETGATDLILMGIDPRNADWVAGADGLLYTDDDNPLGDTTTQTPFEISLRAHIPATAVQGTYEGFLYIEIVPAP